MLAKDRRASLDRTAEGGCPHIDVSQVSQDGRKSPRAYVFSTARILRFAELGSVSQAVRSTSRGARLRIFIR